MTDAPVATRVDTLEYGELEFQEYFVRYRWQPTMKGLRFAGVEAASISAEVSAALAAADAILFGPSNPWLSIAPILAVPGMREALLSRQMPRVAVTPIVDGRALKGPAAKLMTELGLHVSPRTVAEYYGNAINGFVYDKRDAAFDMDGIRTVTLDTVMQTEQDRARLALEVLNWLESW